MGRPVLDIAHGRVPGLLEPYGDHLPLEAARRASRPPPTPFRPRSRGRRCGALAERRGARPSAPPWTVAAWLRPSAPRRPGRPTAPARWGGIIAAVPELGLRVDDDRPLTRSPDPPGAAARAGLCDRGLRFAVLRLTTRSIFVGCSTGRSAGFAPLRILSTNTGARRAMSSKLGA